MTRHAPIQAAAATHVGRVRRLNEDSWRTGPWLAVVADGMGGHASGDLASALAVGAFELADAAEPPRPGEVVATVASANEAIVAAGSEDADRAGMGTTLTGIALVQHDGDLRWLVFNIGDSRVYRLEGATVTQLTTDHSEVAAMVAAGKIQPDEARVHPLRNIVTRALGSDPAPIADTWLLPVTAGDCFLVCSDGLTGELTDEQIGALAAAHADGQELADALVDAAVAAGGRDNVTAIVVQY